MKAVGNFNLPFACKTIKLKLFKGYLRTVSPYDTQQSILKKNFAGF
jgi:phosphatidylserine decarboxylase